MFTWQRSCRRVDIACKNVETLIYRPDSKRSEDLRGTDGQEEIQVELDNRPATCRSSGWTRDRHVARSISKKTDRASDADKVVQTQDIVNTVVWPDPRNYGEAVRSHSREN